MAYYLPPATYFHYLVTYLNLCVFLQQLLYCFGTLVRKGQLNI